jgi:hypothetical protein
MASLENIISTVGKVPSFLLFVVIEITKTVLFWKKKSKLSFIYSSKKYFRSNIADIRYVIPQNLSTALSSLSLTIPATGPSVGRAFSALYNYKITKCLVRQYFMGSLLRVLAFGIFGMLATFQARQSRTLLQACEQEEKNMLLHH